MVKKEGTNPVPISPFNIHHFSISQARGHRAGRRRRSAIPRPFRGSASESICFDSTAPHCKNDPLMQGLPHAVFAPVGSFFRAAPPITAFSTITTLTFILTAKPGPRREQTDIFPAA